MKGDSPVTEITMQSLLTDLGTVVTQVMTWVGNIASTITSTPLLLVTTGFLVLGKPCTLPSLNWANTVKV